MSKSRFLKTRKWKIFDIRKVKNSKASKLKIDEILCKKSTTTKFSSFFNLY